MANWSYRCKPIQSSFLYKSVVDCLNERVTETPDKEILIHRFFGGGRKSLTYKQLQERSIKLAKYLVTNGIKVGDSIGIIGPNSLEWVIGEFAILMSGAVAVHIQKTSEDFLETLQMLKTCNCRAVLIDIEEKTDNLSEIEAYIKSDKPQEQKKENIMFVLIEELEGKSILPSINEVLSTCNNEEMRITLPNVNPESSAIIYSTSGSTGVPKLVEHTHFAIVNATYTSLLPTESETHGIQYNDRPFNWLGGTLVYNILMGFPRVFVDTRLSLEKRNIVCIWNIIVEEKCENAFFLPYTLTDLIQRKVELVRHGYKIRSITTGGQIIGSHFTELINSFCDKLLSVYASTELGAASLINLKPNMEAGDVGTLFPGYEVKIAGDNDVTVNVGDMGEIFVRSPFIMKGYRDAPDLNRASFADGGWLRTGDVGIITTHGKLYVKGKAKDVIKRGGVKTLCSEVESVISRIVGVKDVAVIPVPDARLLEEVCACFVLKDDTSTTEQEIKNTCHGKLGDNILGHSPSFYLKFDDFPQLPNGKTDKEEMKQRALKMLNME